MQKIVVQGEELWLLAGRAVYWPAQKTLIASDLHWGKAGHFRKHGIAIPLKTQENDELRLANIIATHKAERLVIAGDFFHSKQNHQTDGFSHWRKAHSSLTIDLVQGNHDILPAEQYTANDVKVYSDILDTGPFIISHDALPNAEKFYMHGHIHPSFSASGKGRGSVTLPCFCMDDKRLILPSFGSFTGSHRVAQSAFRNIYLVAETEVIQWK